MSAGSHSGPRAGSRMYLCLVKLHQLGGRASRSGWMGSAGFAGTLYAFGLEVNKLVAQGVVYERGDEVLISDDGLRWIDVDVDAPLPEPLPIAGPPYVPPQRALSRSNMPRLRLMRDGALDYLAIPSLHGGDRIEHKTSIKIVGRDGKE